MKLPFYVNIVAEISDIKQDLYFHSILWTVEIKLNKT